MKDFNSQRFFDNLNFLLNEQEMRIGQFEVAAGVKPGYISKMSKNSNAKPGIDFIMRSAQLLAVTLDCLLNTNIKALNLTERYLLRFFEKLTQDTNGRKLEWQVEHGEELQNISRDDEVTNCLLQETPIYIPTASDYPQVDYRMIFKSNTYKEKTQIAGDCYNLRLKNGVRFYLMSVRLDEHSTEIKDHGLVYEAWMYNPQENTAKFLASSLPESKLEAAVKTIYTAVEDYSRSPKLPKGFSSAIEAFLNDDIEDDKFVCTGDDIPF